MGTGMPTSALERPVQIFKQAVDRGQHCPGIKLRWYVVFKHTAKKWYNPLMGWTSSGDPLSNLKLEFETKEQAELYCKNNGLHYEFGRQEQREELEQDYADNFK